MQKDATSRPSVQRFFNFLPPKSSLASLRKGERFCIDAVVDLFRQRIVQTEGDEGRMLGLLEMGQEAPIGVIAFQEAPLDWFYLVPWDREVGAPGA